MFRPFLWIASLAMMLFGFAGASSALAAGNTIPKNIASLSVYDQVTLTASADCSGTITGTVSFTGGDGVVVDVFVNYQLKDTADFSQIFPASNQAVPGSVPFSISGFQPGDEVVVTGGGVFSDQADAVLDGTLVVIPPACQHVPAPSASFTASADCSNVVSGTGMVNRDGLEGVLLVTVNGNPATVNGDSFSFGGASQPLVVVVMIGDSVVPVTPPASITMATGCTTTTTAAPTTTSSAPATTEAPTTTAAPPVTTAPATTVAPTPVSSSMAPPMTMTMPPGGLPKTGSSSGTIALVAAFILGLGLVMVRLRRPLNR